MFERSEFGRRALTSEKRRGPPRSGGSRPGGTRGGLLGSSPTSLAPAGASGLPPDIAEAAFRPLVAAYIADQQRLFEAISAKPRP